MKQLILKLAEKLTATMAFILLGATVLLHFGSIIQASFILKAILVASAAFMVVATAAILVVKRYLGLL